MMTPFIYNITSTTEIESSVDKALSILNKYKHLSQDYNSLFGKNDNYNVEYYLITIEIISKNTVSIKVRADDNHLMIKNKNGIKYTIKLIHEENITPLYNTFKNTMNHIFNVFKFAGKKMEDKKIQVNYLYYDNRINIAMTKEYSFIHDCKKELKNINSIIEDISINIERDLKLCK